MNAALAKWEAAEARAERKRWLGSVALLLVVCSAVAVGLQWQPRAAVPPLLPAAAMMVVLAPLPQSPAEPSAQPPGPQQVEAPVPTPPEPDIVLDPEPLPEPLLEPVPEPLPEPPPQPAEVSLPTSATPPKPRREIASEHPPASASTAPPSQDTAPVEVAAAPDDGALSKAAATARMSFQQSLLVHLERHKRYPRAAQMRRQQGLPYVRFIMDREGTVLTASLEQGSGHTLLDEEALALLARAQPLPRLPDDIVASTLEVVVPVEFFLRR